MRKKAEEKKSETIELTFREYENSRDSYHSCYHPERKQYYLEAQGKIVVLPGNLEGALVIQNIVQQHTIELAKKAVARLENLKQAAQSVLE